MYTFNSKDELAKWISHEVVGTSEAMEIMDCTRQNLHKFVQNGKLVPIKDTGRERLFLRSDLLARKEAASVYNRKNKVDKLGE